MKKEIKDVFITGTGHYLPGPAISNEEIENYLGLINDKPSKSKKRILKSNQIKLRHYAIDKNHNITHTNAEMAKNAILNAIDNSPIHLDDLQLLSASTTLGDVLAPGHGSMVHGELGGPTLEVNTAHGICSSSMMAIKNAFMQIQTGSKRNATAVGSEFVSRTFRNTRYNAQKEVKEKGVGFDTDFLRWMLSDGAGALILQDKPRPNGKSLRIEWVDIRSHANQFETCMYLGGNKDKKTGKISSTWYTEKNELESTAKGHFNLKQDIKMLDNVVKIGVKHFVDLVENKKVDLDQLDWMVCHYSSHFFKSKIHDFMKKAGLNLPEEKWYTNLYERGNTGAASIFIMLDEFLKTKDLKAGAKILCQVPESGRFISSYMLCTVVDNTDSNTKTKTEMSVNQKNVTAPQFSGDFANNKLTEKLVRNLGSTWIDFEIKLNSINIVNKLNKSQFTIEAYKNLLLNLRPQVIEGNAWIARMISNISKDYFDFRSFAFKHALYGHKDYGQLDHDYVSVGGKIEDIENAERNIGSEALNAYMLQEASKKNPFCMLGAMYIIEGLSSKVCTKWKTQIGEQLNLTDNQLTFLTHHATHEDENITSPIESIIAQAPLTSELVDEIIKTAKTTARLYLLQLEEINNY